MIRNAVGRVTQPDPTCSRKLKRGGVIFLFYTPYGHNHTTDRYRAKAFRKVEHLFVWALK